MHHHLSIFEVDLIQDVIVSYLVRNDMANCVRVSRAWNNAFLPRLWRFVSINNRVELDAIRTPEARAGIVKNGHLIRQLHITYYSALEPFAFALLEPLTEDDYEEEKTKEERVNEDGSNQDTIKVDQEQKKGKQKVTEPNAPTTTCTGLTHLMMSLVMDYYDPPPERVASALPPATAPPPTTSALPLAPQAPTALSAPPVFQVPQAPSASSTVQSQFDSGAWQTEGTTLPPSGLEVSQLSSVTPNHITHPSLRGRGRGRGRGIGGGGSLGRGQGFGFGDGASGSFGPPPVPLPAPASPYSMLYKKWETQTLTIISRSSSPDSPRRARSPRRRTRSPSPRHRTRSLSPRSRSRSFSPHRGLRQRTPSRDRRSRTPSPGRCTRSPTPESLASAPASTITDSPLGIDDISKNVAPSPVETVFGTYTPTANTTFGVSKGDDSAFGVPATLNAASSSALDSSIFGFSTPMSSTAFGVSSRTGEASSSTAETPSPVVTMFGMYTPKSNASTGASSAFGTGGPLSTTAVSSGTSLAFGAHTFSRGFGSSSGTGSAFGTGASLDATTSTALSVSSVPTSSSLATSPAFGTISRASGTGFGAFLGTSSAFGSGAASEAATSTPPSMFTASTPTSCSAFGASTWTASALGAGTVSGFGSSSSSSATTSPFGAYTSTLNTAFGTGASSSSSFTTNPSTFGAWTPTTPFGVSTTTPASSATFGTPTTAPGSQGTFRAIAFGARVPPFGTTAAAPATGSLFSEPPPSLFGTTTPLSPFGTPAQSSFSFGRTGNPNAIPRKGCTTDLITPLLIANPRLVALQLQSVKLFPKDRAMDYVNRMEHLESLHIQTSFRLTSRLLPRAPGLVPLLEKGLPRRLKEFNLFLNNRYSFSPHWGNPPQELVLAQMKEDEEAETGLEMKDQDCEEKVIIYHGLKSLFLSSQDQTFSGLRDHPGGGVQIFLRLLERCPDLTKLQISDMGNLEMLGATLGRSCPLLTDLTLIMAPFPGSSQGKEEDDTLASFLRVCPRLRRLYLICVNKCGIQTVGAILEQHGSTLEHFFLSSSQDFPSWAILQILKFCPRLESLQGSPNCFTSKEANFLNIVEIVGDGRSLAVGGSGGLNSWACFGSLTVLEMAFEWFEPGLFGAVVESEQEEAEEEGEEGGDGHNSGIHSDEAPPLSASFFPKVKPTTQPPQKPSKEIQIWQALYHHLNQLTRLQKLTLQNGSRFQGQGKEIPIPSTGSFPSSSSSQYSTPLSLQSRFHVHKGSIEFSLDQGLALLTSLKQMRVLDLSDLRHKVYRQEVEWMREHWPKLVDIRGVVKETPEAVVEDIPGSRFGRGRMDILKQDLFLHTTDWTWRKERPVEKAIFGGSFS